MGSVCCVSGRDATTSEAANADILRRTVQYSPSWGIRWDNRGRVAGADTAVDEVRWNDRLENKSEPVFEPSPEISVLEENLDGNHKRSLPLSREMEGVGMQSKAYISGSPEDHIISLQMKVITEKMPAHEGQTLSALSDYPSPPYPSPSSFPSKSHIGPASSTPSKRSPRIPKSHFFRQGSDSLLRRSNSPCNFSTSEGTSPPMFPVSSIDSTWRSHGGSFDGLSVQSFPENTTSTHRQTWSFGSKSLDSRCLKMKQSQIPKSDSHSNELKTCLLCSKCVDVNAVVAILECGHLYHADCLEHLTPEISKYDPPCPVCTLGEKGAEKKMIKHLKQDEKMKAKMFDKLLHNGMDTKPKNKKHRNSVVDDDFEVPLTSNSYYEPSSSLRSSLAKPFLKRHFSFNSKARSSSSENHPFRNRSLLCSKSSK